MIAVCRKFVLFAACRNYLFVVCRKLVLFAVCRSYLCLQCVGNVFCLQHAEVTFICSRAHFLLRLKCTYLFCL